jgi:hypothetical protein
MANIVPSYVAKVARAKEHLVDLQLAVNQYAGTHPYTVRKRIEGKKKQPVWRIELTAQPANSDIPILAADAIYNLRSSLDHLMSALVAPKDRGSAMFPIFFQGVWERASAGDNEQRVKDRLRWASYVKSLPDGAVTVLKSLQPPDTSPDDPATNLLRLINRLSNRDRHEKLPIVAAGLSELELTITMPDGTMHEAIGYLGGEDALQDHAQLHGIAPGTVHVQIAGVALVAIQGRLKNRYIPIPRRLVHAAIYIDARIIPELLPFTR